jgi:hypothetical protein
MIYFIENTVDRAIKIGFSANPYRRLRRLQKQTRDRLRLLHAHGGNIQLEHEIHRRMRECNGRTGEWYPPAPWMLDRKRAAAFVAMAAEDWGAENANPAAGTTGVALTERTKHAKEEYDVATRKINSPAPVQDPEKAPPRRT